mmetsp:Transcript_7718/g.16012  ORF Transcript_7718/g.16012 Transcript_7718/m.16012 type:complete len:496 (+) Transcript_7718:58-1545(+)
MTEGTATAAPSSGPRRKPRRKRNPGKKNESQPKGSKSKAKKSGNNNNSGPPPPPQIKITIRNIQNSEKFGTVKSVLEDLVSKLLESCVEKKANNQYIIELDRAAVRHLITEEEKITERRQRLIREKAQKEEESKDENPAEEGEIGEMEGTKEEEKVAEEIYQLIKEEGNKLDVIVAPKAESNLPTITARPSYVVPPRKTKRRGEHGGTAYVLLIGPKIEKKKDPPVIPPVSSPEEKESTEEEKTEADECGEVKTAESKETPVEKAAAAPEQVVNYPQELAKGRLLLSNAIKALIELVTEDTKSQEYTFSGCIVEHSMNGKTWKIFPNNNSRPDRREGTIESTSDFKDWLETTVNQKEELKARPKPVPGGGMAASSAADEVLEEDGQPVSSLVQHLRAKKLDAKRKKSQKKKKKEENNKKGETADDKKKKRNEKKNRKNNNAANGGKKIDPTAAAAKKAKRKKKERAKKKEKAKALAAAASAGAKPPTALLKPAAT